jgi:hypothetical protein
MQLGSNLRPRDGTSDPRPPDRITDNHLTKQALPDRGILVSWEACVFSTSYGIRAIFCVFVLAVFFLASGVIMLHQHHVLLTERKYIYRIICINFCTKIIRQPCKVTSDMNARPTLQYCLFAQRKSRHHRSQITWNECFKGPPERQVKFWHMIYRLILKTLLTDIHKKKSRALLILM